MMCLPAALLFTGPLPPVRFEARFFAATILAPLVFLAMVHFLYESRLMIWEMIKASNVP